MTSPPGPPLMQWEKLTVGDRLQPFTFDLSPDLVAAYRSALADDVLTSVGGRAVAPPTMLTIPMLKAIDNTWRPREGAVHAKQGFEFLGPVPVDTRLTVTGQLTQLYLRRGRRYLVVETEVMDEDGRLLARGQTVGLYPNREATP